MNEYITKSIIELTFSVISIIITSVLMPVLTTWLKSKIANERFRSVITDLSSTVESCVNCCEQTVVRELKESGSWDSEAKQRVKELVTENVIENLLESTKKVFADNQVDLKKVVAQHIESYILKQK